MDLSFTTDHLSRLQTKKTQTKIVRERFLNKQLYVLHSSTRPWYADLVNYLVIKEFLSGLSKFQKDKLWAYAKYYFSNTPYLWKFCADEVVRRCVPYDEFHSILTFFFKLILVVGILEQKEQPTRYLKVSLLAFYF